MPKFVFSLKKATTDRLKSKLADLSKGLSQAESKEAGKITIEGMKRMIAVGLSPIAGNGRFPGYKKPEKYPGKRKNKRPVNLYLSGDFLGSLESKNIKTTKGYQPSIGFRDKKSRDKEQGHREGANTQPKRPIIPDTDRNELIAKTIEVSILDYLKQVLRERVRKG